MKNHPDEESWGIAVGRFAADAFVGSMQAPGEQSWWADIMGISWGYRGDIMGISWLYPLVMTNIAIENGHS